jgi:hypothetical protein
MGDRRCAYRVLILRSEGTDSLGRPRHSWEIILKWIFKEWYVEAWSRLIWLRTGTGCGLLLMQY